MTAWIQEKSNGKITTLEGGVSPEYPLCILNATYFFAHWANPFDKRKTKPEKFWNYAQQKKETKFMRGQFSLHYSEGEDFQAVVLPYECDGMVMVLIVPIKKLGLFDFERTITEGVIQKMLATKSETVILKMPKFSIESSFSVLEALSAMGVSDLSNISEISADSRLRIGQINHKAFIDVNEESTEAAALTEVVITGGTGSGAELPHPKVVTADHPFMFLLIHEATKTITFMGRVVDVNSTN